MVTQFSVQEGCKLRGINEAHMVNEERRAQAKLEIKAFKASVVLLLSATHGKTVSMKGLLVDPEWLSHGSL